MARYLGPNCKLCRRENMKLYLKGDRCYSAKCSLEKKAYPPGQHGKTQKKISDYGSQLREKQKVKRTYGVLEAQFRRYFDNAVRMKGITGENLIQLLERRLDNVIYRAGFANSRKEARQIVRHNHVLVNGKKVNIPSYTVIKGEVISLKQDARNFPGVLSAVESADGKGSPEWLSVDKKEFKVDVARLPERSDVNYEIHESLIVELYSK